MVCQLMQYGKIKYIFLLVFNLAFGYPIGAISTIFEPIEEHVPL